MKQYINEEKGVFWFKSGGKNVENVSFNYLHQLNNSLCLVQILKKKRCGLIANETNLHKIPNYNCYISDLVQAFSDESPNCIKVAGISIIYDNDV